MSPFMNRPPADTVLADSTGSDMDGVPHAESPTSPDTVSWGLSQGDCWFLLVCGTVLCVLMGVHVWRLASGGRETIEVRHQPEGGNYVFQLDMNSATWVEWMQLDGVGEVTARRIVDDRESNGPFESIDDLDRVKGIGPATVEKLRPHLRCEVLAVSSDDASQ